MSELPDRAAPEPHLSHGVTRRGCLRVGCALAAVGAASCLGASANAMQVEPAWIEVTEVEVRLPAPLFAFPPACGMLQSCRAASAPPDRGDNPLQLELQRLEVGPWPMNCYLLRCRSTGRVAVIDPGADAPAILAAAGGGAVACILLTHGHPDHVGALDELRRATGAPVGVHPADAEAWGIDADFPLLDGMEVEIGRGRAAVVHVPGHTPGSVCLRLDGRAVVGDAIFPGGPGHTESPEALAASLVSLGQTVFTWPDATELYPGHGGPTTVGAERAAYEQFLAADHPPGLCGDVTWR